MIYSNLYQLNQYLKRLSTNQLSYLDSKKDGRLLGLDLGKKNIGIAISDRSRSISNPKFTIKRKGNVSDFILLKNIIDEEKVIAVIIGLPIAMNSSETIMSQFVRNFAHNLDEFLIKNNQEIAILLYDERLTSFSAREIVRKIYKGKKRNNKNLTDQIAANIILSDVISQLLET